MRQVGPFHYEGSPHGTARETLDAKKGTMSMRTIDGVDATPEMLDRARERRVFASLQLADVCATGLPAATYDLVTTCLVDEHLAEITPLYAEVARIARDGGAYVLVGFHPFFIMATGMPTHFKASDGEPKAIETHVHLSHIMWRRRWRRGGNLPNCASKSSMIGG